MKRNRRLTTFCLDHCILCSNCGFSTLSWGFLIKGFKAYQAAALRRHRAEGPLELLLPVLWCQGSTNSWRSSGTSYNHQLELCESHSSLTCEEPTAKGTFCKYIALSHYLMRVWHRTGIFFDNSADEIMRAKTFHCQKIGLPLPPTVASFLEIYRKNGTIRHFIRCCPDSEVD